MFDVYCFYLLIFKLLTLRDDFNPKKKDETFWNNSSLSTQKHAYWRLYYNPELFKITLGKERTQMNECVDSAMLSKTRGQLQVQT